MSARCRDIRRRGSDRCPRACGWCEACQRGGRSRALPNVLWRCRARVCTAPSGRVQATSMCSGRGTRPRTLKKDRQPPYCSSVSADSLMTWGLSMTTGSAPGSGWDHDGGGAGDADLRGGHAHALTEHVLLADPVQRPEQPGDHGVRLVGLVRELEGDGPLVQDGVAVLNDSRCFHSVCRGTRFGTLLLVVGPVSEARCSPRAKEGTAPATGRPRAGYRVGGTVAPAPAAGEPGEGMPGCAQRVMLLDGFVMAGWSRVLPHCSPITEIRISEPFLLTPRNRCWRGGDTRLLLELRCWYRRSESVRL
jgi:hypothetical protein